jgi:ATP-dependent helicase/nuclease subunit A
MTVHASKGLEFPIVFVVNIGRGVARRKSPVRVHLSGDDEEGAASVSVESFLSEQDSLEPELEREETKRLLYVALTRARDRLYLSAAAKDGAVRMGPGSLGQSLPATLQKLIDTAGSAGDGEALAWAGRGGAHALRVAAPAAEPPPVPAVAGARPDGASPVADWSLPRLDAAVPRAPVTADAAEASGEEDWDSDGAEAAGGRLVGRLVHRLLARVPPGSPPDAPGVAALARTLVTDEERALVPELDAAVARAVALHQRLVGRADLVALFAEGTAAFEVPVSLAADGRVLRGTIDCLIRRPDGSLIVVEVKTGPPRPAHQRQLDAYLTAVQALGPGIRATGSLIHP